MTDQPLRRELSAAIENAISPVLNRSLGAGLPPLRWAVRTDGGGDPAWDGQVPWGDYAPGDVRRVVEQWATALGFEAAEDGHGALEFRGWVGDVFVSVWGVVDRDLFEKVLPPAKRK